LFSFKSESKKKKNNFNPLNNTSNNFFNNMVSTTDENSESSLNISRKISNKPYKVLEAPGLLDDFYLNLVDWSNTNDLAVGLNNTVYLWCANKTQVVKLLSYEGEKYVSSVIWNPNGTEVAVGNSDGMVEIWDVCKKKISRILEGHSARVGVVAWNNQQTLSTGSKDYSIINRDLRQISNAYSKYLGHKQEVCGLKWSFDGTQLASGGNDNKLMVWNMHSTTPVMKSSHHSAAVKAIAWSPHQNNLLASGGGTADRCIRFWNTSNYSQVSYVDTGSQVCNLVFSKTVNELVSTHGYSLNQIITWKLPNMQKLATLTGHTYRVLYLSISPDGQNIVTGAGDETLRFWNIFPPMKSSYEGSSLFPSNTDLR
jgi:cell division cycle 20-like protein 1 (cofactor of APC complex)